VALRNRWRRQRLSDELREEVTPKNILMIGPTGCGKTEISRRLAKLADAPFVKVEATKFTEVGYVGRDVEQIARDLVEEAVRLEKERRRDAVREAASEAAMERLLDALTGKDASAATRESFRQRLHENHLNDKEVEIEVVQDAPPFEIPGMGGQVGMINLSDMMGKAFGQQPRKKRRMRVAEAWDKLVEEESDKRLDADDVNRTALKDAEANGIVFLDEIDKIAVSDVRGGSVSREGVQRDLLPLIEGTTVATKYGPMKTDHILFIASGAFHVAKPSDLLPELQGRLPIRVELKALTEEDFVRILSDTRASLTAQYTALIETEGVDGELHRRRHPGHRADRRRSERPGREYRRPPPPDGDGEAARGRQLRRRGAKRRHCHRRRSLCGEAARRDRAQHGSQQVRALGDSRHPGLDPGSTFFDRCP
jgi:ATP-dependent HslUV protease ATP-binding subunit HslU